MLGGQSNRSAPRLAREVRRVEPAAAFTTAGDAELGGEICVVLQEQRVEPGVGQQPVAQRRDSFFFVLAD